MSDKAIEIREFCEGCIYQPMCVLRHSAIDNAQSLKEVPRYRNPSEENSSPAMIEFRVGVVGCTGKVIKEKDND